MSTLKISVGTRICRELCELDWNGEIIPRSESKNYWLEIPTSIEGLDPENVFSLMTTVIAKISGKGLPADHWSKESMVKALTATRLAKDFAQRKTWRVFAQAELDLAPMQPGGEVPAESSDAPAVNVEVSADLYQQLLADSVRIKETNKTYEKAKNRLYDLAAHHLGAGQSSHAAEVHALLGFIEECNRRSADGFMAGWYAEKTPGVRDSFEDLFKRKNSAHPGYRQSADYARSNLYSFNAPFAYLQEPPSTHMVKGFLG